MKKKKISDPENFIAFVLYAILGFALLTFLLSTPAFSEETGNHKSCSVLLSSREVRQGGVISADVFLLFGDIKYLSGTFNGKKLIFFKNGTEARALVGIDLYQKPGEYELKIIYKDEVFVEKIAVKEGEFPVSYGWGRGKPYTKQDAARIIKEKRDLRNALEKSRAKNLPKMWKTFETPIDIAGNFTLKDYMTTPFGQIRILEKGKYGKSKRWHQGTDFLAPQGTPIGSMADGVVAYIGRDLFMEGNIVIINHGAEVYTMYMHLSAFWVKKIGQKVEAGELIGWSGSTGNSNKAHLHLGMKIDGALIDPLRIFEIK